MKLPPKVAPLRLFGQEINPSTFAMARMNAFIHDMEAEIALGDTMHRPAFTAARRSAAAVRPGDRQPDVEPEVRRRDLRKRHLRAVQAGRTALVFSADWGWIQHMAGSLKDLIFGHNFFQT